MGNADTAVMANTLPEGGEGGATSLEASRTAFTWIDRGRGDFRRPVVMGNELLKQRADVILGIRLIDIRPILPIRFQPVMRHARCKGERYIAGGENCSDAVCGSALNNQVEDSRIDNFGRRHLQTRGDVKGGDALKTHIGDNFRQRFRDQSLILDDEYASRCSYW